MNELVSKYKWTVVALVIGWVVLIALGIPWMVIDPAQWWFFAGVSVVLGIFYTAIVGGVTAVIRALKQDPVEAVTKGMVLPDDEDDFDIEIDAEPTNPYYSQSAYDRIRFEQGLNPRPKNMDVNA